MMRRTPRIVTRSLLGHVQSTSARVAGISSWFRQLRGPTKPFPAGIKVLHDPKDAVVDVIFVHGLTGDREKTWTANGASEPWPKALLPSKLPRARILTVGYDANVVGLFGVVSQNSIGNHAENLLNWVAPKIDRENERPIIFVCHSLGGLVCQEVWSSTCVKARTHPSTGFEPVRQKSAFTPPKCSSIDPRHRFPRDTTSWSRSCYRRHALGLPSSHFYTDQCQDLGSPQKGFRGTCRDQEKVPQYDDKTDKRRGTVNRDNLLL
ncbi:hypothetical protein B0T25DRAFT_293939 [Lasiosphaeria hispida]|uniref:DUF676 domain-containing protein n=1 Tax=Lasiosphaeria hispida TaxID=260671 RepID=A0AAJ0HCH7_9PEZI|nr:hypothetical protein B0T25DRAFT_293939 [Lasiosphaeria hispida]